MTPELIIIAAHGDGDGSPVNTRARALANRLRGSDPPRDATAAFNLGSPSFAHAAAACDGAPPLVIPLMTSDGYFVRERLIPEIARTRPGAAVTPPIGADPALRARVADRAADAVRCGPDAGGLILVVGHGTTRHARSDATTRELADLISARVRTFAPSWRAAEAFLDQEPFIEHTAAARGAHGPLVVVPWLIGGGGHDRDDIAQRLGLAPGAARGEWIAGSARTPAHYVLPALLDSADPARITRRMIRRAVSRLPLRLATRRSTLAMWQAERVRARLAAAGVPAVLTPIDSAGDRDRSRLADAPGMFTDELTDAIELGEADAAVHSLKDLPLETEASAHPIAAVLERDAAAEALVSTNGERIERLRPGAAVGTSSARRAAHVRAMRPDLRTVPIRGPVDERVRLVRSGAYDAAVLAAAGLERIGLAAHIAQRFDARECTPAPGQGVIAVQAGRDDWFAWSMVSRLDHAPTRLAVDAERGLARRRAADPTISVCALATATPAGARAGGIRMNARLVTTAGITAPVVVEAGDPEAAAERAAEMLGAPVVARTVEEVRAL